jgi:anaphase-promoting complex subunit 1
MLRFHLQAFRHLYVLASEPRLLLSKDVDTGEFCYVPVEITLKANEHHNAYTFEQMAPCILPELNKIGELRILGPRHYPIRFKHSLDFDELRNILMSELLVKQRNGYFSYADDPKDEKAFNIRNFLNKAIIPHRITPQLLEKITNEEHVNLFAKMLNKPTTTNDNKLDAKINRLLKFIYESVVQETFDFVGVMLLLDEEAKGDVSSHFIQQIKLLDGFYKSLVLKSAKHIILTQEFMHFLISSLETRLNGQIRSKFLKVF